MTIFFHQVLIKEFVVKKNSAWERYTLYIYNCVS